MPFSSEPPVARAFPPGRVSGPVRRVAESGMDRAFSLVNPEHSFQQGRAGTLCLRSRWETSWAPPLVLTAREILAPMRGTPVRLAPLAVNRDIVEAAMWRA